MSALDFATEMPCPKDWEVWIDFWAEVTFPGFVLVTSLGPWVHKSHRPNEWFYNSAADSLFQRAPGGGNFYVRSNSELRALRSQQLFAKAGPSPSIPDLEDFLPCATTRIDDETVVLGATGPKRYEKTVTQHDLFSLLRSWGGEWMWEHIEVVGELDTVIEAIKEGRAIWCTDGSFDRLQMPNVSSAGWVIFDSVSKQHIKGSFFEVSEDASAYRGELLGLTALHLVAAAISELFGVIENSNELFCDNERALGKAKLYRRRVPSASKRGDLLRLLRNLRPQLMTAFVYLHVYGHADDKKGRGNLTLVERLNCMCDALAKLARLRYWTAEREVTTQILPKERAALFLHNQKQTGDISEATRYAIGKVQARLFYVNELGWTAERFDRVDWDALNATLSKKDLMYTLWLTKQATKFCGSRVQVARE
jgi:hypothetical protein